jgi:hypothetical protein
VRSTSPQTGSSGLKDGVVRRVQVTLDDDIKLQVPPPGLYCRTLLYVVPMFVVGAVALLGAPLLGLPEVLVLPAMVLGILLWAGAGNLVLRCLLDRVRVVVSSEGMSVTHNYPLPHTGVITRDGLRRIVVGRRGVADRGYLSHELPHCPLVLVAFGNSRVLTFGEGVSAEELEWLRSLILDALRPDGSIGATTEPDPNATVTQPPEARWGGLVRTGAVCMALAFVAALGAWGVLGQTTLAGSMAFLAALSLTAVVFAYRGYRREYVASGWHRAVLKSLAASMGYRFAVVDVAAVARRLPDFRFFRGPRRFYNVLWGGEEGQELIAFDFTSRVLWGVRDGVGCVLPTDGVSHERLSICPRSRGRAVLLRQGLRLPGAPEFSQVYHVEADNDARARNLLGEEVVAAVSAWRGAGEPPWICMASGMIGFSIRRNEAGNDLDMQEFYDYAHSVRDAVRQRVVGMRTASSMSSGGSSGSGSSIRGSR